jgi:hypothetical protein
LRETFAHVDALGESARDALLLHTLAMLCILHARVCPHCWLHPCARAPA